MTENEKNILRKFTISVLHGDLEHRTWLLNECEKFINGDDERKRAKIIEAVKWYEQGIEDAGGCVGDGVFSDFEDQYGDQF